SEMSGLSHQIAAGRQRQICSHRDCSLHLPHCSRGQPSAQYRVMPGDNKGHAEHPGDGQSQPTCLQPVCVHQIRANESTQAGQRPDIKAKLFEPLDLSRRLRTEHPYLVPALLQPWGDTGDVAPDATGTGGQELSDLHGEPTSADGVRRRSAHIWASRAGARSRSIVVNTKTQTNATAQAPSTATTMPTSASSCDPAA